MNTNQSISNTQTVEGLPLSIPEEVKKPQFEYEQLLKALYWCYDIFDRANMQFLLIFATGRQVKNNELLNGDHLDIGIRKLEWESGGKRILDAFIDQDGIKEIEKNGKTTYIAEGVPVVITILKDDPCVTQPDIVMYQMEDFKLPNPFSRFEEVFGSG